MTIIELFQQIAALAAQGIAQSGGTTSSPDTGSGSLNQPWTGGPILRSKIIPAPLTDNLFQFIAHEGVCNFSTASTGQPPVPSQNGTLTIMDMNGAVIVGPESFSFDQSAISASALTAGDMYQLRMTRTVAGNAYVQYN